MKESLTNTTALMYLACANICLLQWTIGERARSATFWQFTRGEANLFAPSVWRPPSAVRPRIGRSGVRVHIPREKAECCLWNSPARPVVAQGRSHTRGNKHIFPFKKFAAVRNINCRIDPRTLLNEWNSWMVWVRLKFLGPRTAAVFLGAVCTKSWLLLMHERVIEKRESELSDY